MPSAPPVRPVAGLHDNTPADGFFHLATWLCVAGATVRARPRRELAPPWRARRAKA